MPLFAISNQRLSAMEQSNFSAEKTLRSRSFVEEVFDESTRH